MRTLTVTLAVLAVLGAVMVERGRQPRGPQERHGHSEFLTLVAHDQLLHQQFVLPLTVETGRGFATGTSGSGGTYATIETQTITVPDWAESVSVVAIGTVDVSGPPSVDGIVNVRLDIEGDIGGISRGHFHNGLHGFAAAAHAFTVASPGSTVTVKVDVEADGEPVAADLLWEAIFERFE